MKLRNTEIQEKWSFESMKYSVQKFESRRDNPHNLRRRSEFVEIIIGMFVAYCCNIVLSENKDLKNLKTIKNFQIFRKFLEKFSKIFF